MAESQDEVERGANIGVTHGSSLLRVLPRVLRRLLPWVPLIAFVVISALTYFSPVHTGMPSVEFYRVAAEVIPLLLLATMVERDTFGGLSQGIRGEYIVTLAFAEIAALLAVSGMFVPDEQKKHALRVGGTTWGTNLIACMIGTGLVGVAFLVVWVVFAGGETSGLAKEPKASSNLPRADPPDRDRLAVAREPERLARKSLYAWLASVGGLVVTFWLVGRFASTTKGGFAWGPASAAATAYGTLVLALVTWGLFSSARAESRRSRRLALLAEEDRQARQRPFVFWFSRHDAADDRNVVSVQNGGGGLALNVTGWAYWLSGSAELTSTTLFPGDTARLSFAGDVADQSEFWIDLVYVDILNRRWETRLTLDYFLDGRQHGTLCQHGLAYGTEGGLMKEPTPPGGWEMAAWGAPVLALPVTGEEPR